MPLATPHRRLSRKAVVVQVPGGQSQVTGGLHVHPTSHPNPHPPPTDNPPYPLRPPASPSPTLFLGTLRAKKLSIRLISVLDPLSLFTVVQPYISLCIVCVIFIGRFCLAGGIKQASADHSAPHIQSVTDQVAPAQNPVLCRAGRCSRVPSPPPHPAASTTPPCLPVSADPHRPA